MKVTMMSPETSTVKPSKTKPKKKHRFRNFFFGFCLTSVFLVTMAIFIGFSFIRQRLDNMAVVDAQFLRTYETSKILDANGNVIWEPTDRRVTILEYDEIPKLYLDALIAVEDDGYWTSPGVSYRGIANMVYTTLMHKYIDPTVKPRGGSTLEQQLIKNVYYNGGEGYETTTRKIQEIFLALQLDQNFSKEEILTFYVNNLEFAEGAIGVGQVMKTYFGKTPADYQERTPEVIAELAYMAGLSNAPTAYNLYEDPEKAEYRTDIVLYAMLENGLITQQEYEDAKAFDLTTNLKERGREAAAQAAQNRRWKIYTDGVLAELKDLGYDLARASITVKTFLDPAVFDDVNAIARQDEHFLDYDQQTGVAVVRHDGIVVALVGGRYDDEFNRAMSSNRSSGSSMKPFTAYGPLFQYFGDQYTTATLLDTSNYKYPGTELYMHNYAGGVYGMQELKRCLRKSYNTPVARICDEVLGSTRMKTFLHGVGLDTKESYSALDGIGLYVSPLQSAAAYNALSNYGVYTKPRFIDTITFSDGSVRVIEPRSNQAMNPSVAYVLTQILKGVLSPEGTAGGYKVNGWDGYAGKSGSVNFSGDVNPPAPYGVGGSDVWFCSYTRDGYAVSVWAGYDVPTTSPQIPDYYNGQKDICLAIQKYLNGDRQIPDWEMPEGVEHISGAGLAANYRVTDSKDLDETGIEWQSTDLSAFVVNEVRPEYEIDANWMDKEDPVWIDYYRENGAEVPDVIDAELYAHLDG